ncbi:hypothetical protein ACFQL1_14495 [Halomicroarcula sp. GCM10025709]|uniref:DUF7109 family protein n=1 Tax=Haloarcula TaxID=2237 RepID=UPI0024C254D4|nr:hypothetical protein [Halomicroarcula sp. YJ-61-S]
MDLSADELAGVVDLFGALSRAELRQACAELAFKRGEETDPTAYADDIAAAVESYHLVAVAAEDGETDLLAVGPTAFPSLPEGAGDLPHIMDVPDRELARDRVVEAVERQFRADAAAAIDAGDEARIAALLDVSYDLDAWGAVDLGEARDRLDAA